MSEKNKNTGVEAEQMIQELRQRIDAIDDRIIALLQERSGFVEQVGTIKHQNAAGKCPIRPGREALMVRRIYQEFADKKFSPAAAAAMWRTIISASTAMEKELKISVLAPDHDMTFYWLAREYFGSFTPIFEQYTASRVVGDIIDGKASVGILPIPREGEQGQWWMHLAQGSDDFPKIFAHVPFVVDAKPGRNNVSALAIAKVTPEPTGDDITYIAIEVEHNVSMHKLQGAFANAGLQASWVSVTSPTALTRYHLVEVRAFITRDDALLQKFLNELGNAIMNCVVLGSYAAPIHHSETKSHDAKRAQAKSASA